MIPHLVLGIDASALEVLRSLRAAYPLLSPAERHPLSCLAILVSDKSGPTAPSFPPLGGAEVLVLPRRKFDQSLDAMLSGAAAAPPWFPLAPDRDLASEVRSFGGSRPLGRLVLECHREPIETALRQALERLSQHLGPTRILLVAETSAAFAAGALGELVALCQRQAGIDSIAAYLLLPPARIPAQADLATRDRINTFATLKELSFRKSAPPVDLAGLRGLSGYGLAPLRLFLVDGKDATEKATALLLSQLFQPIQESALALARELEDPQRRRRTNGWGPIHLHTASACFALIEEPSRAALGPALDRALREMPVSGPEDDGGNNPPGPGSTDSAGAAQAPGASAPSAAVPGLDSVTEELIAEIDKAVGRILKPSFSWLPRRFPGGPDFTDLEELAARLALPPVLGDGEETKPVPREAGTQGDLARAIETRLRRLSDESLRTALAPCEGLAPALRARCRRDKLEELHRAAQAQATVECPPPQELVAERQEHKRSHDEVLGLPAWRRLFSKPAARRRLEILCCHTWNRVRERHADWLHQALCRMIMQARAEQLARQLAEEPSPAAANQPAGAPNQAAGPAQTADPPAAETPAPADEPLVQAVKAVLAADPGLQARLRASPGQGERAACELLVASAIQRRERLSCLGLDNSGAGEAGLGCLSLSAMITRCENHLFNSGGAQPGRSFQVLRLPSEGLSEEQFQAATQNLSAQASSALGGTTTIAAAGGGPAWVYREDLFHPAEQLALLATAHYDLSQCAVTDAFFTDRKLCSSETFQGLWANLAATPVLCGNAGCTRDIAGLPRDRTICPGCGRTILSRCGNLGCSEDRLHEHPQGKDRFCPRCNGLNHAAIWICDQHRKSEVINTNDNAFCVACVQEHREDPSRRPWAAVSRRPGLQGKMICWSCQDRAAGEPGFEPFVIPADLVPFVRNGVSDGQLKVFTEKARLAGLKQDFRCPKCEAILIPVERRSRPAAAGQPDQAPA